MQAFQHQIVQLVGNTGGKQMTPLDKELHDLSKQIGMLVNPHLYHNLNHQDVKDYMGTLEGKIMVDEVYFIMDRLATIKRSANSLAALCKKPVFCPN